MMPEPEGQQADGPAGRVNENIRDHWCARGHEPLVKFIRRGENKNEQQRTADFRPRPGRQVVVGHVQRAPEQHGEDGIFGHVGAFAKDMVDFLDVELGHIRKQPVQERHDET